jgi:hypothetical protein
VEINEMINNIRTELLTTDLFTSNEPFSFKNYLNHYNIMDNEINDFLKPNEKIFFREKPYLYNNMKEAVDLFKWHYFAGEDIYILSDSGDVDGLTSTVILYQYIQTMTSIMQNELPNMPSKVKIFIHEHRIKVALGCNSKIQSVLASFRHRKFVDDVSDL